ncbi:MAG: pantoate--beta-alanine ligase [Candidatus Omnitrophica bacterium]|nr:pantoate--beta-alanine ligase [Candidatus Omnitrophota bacterium]
MVIIHKIRRLRQALSKYRRKEETVGFVPTMGALHAGHLSLIKAAIRQNKRVVVSIFVNPAQFGPGEDFKQYPRTLKRDAASCRKEGVDIIFCPDTKELFPRGYKTFVTVEGLSQVMCGIFRPGHFRGVATVVAKLFNIVQPDIVYFGQKDAQQAMIIKKMVQDLDMPLKIKVMPTVRESDGLAMSSRNVYLNKQQRLGAQVLSRSLALAKELAGAGIKDADKIVSSMRQLIRKNANARIDYIAVVDPTDLKPLKKISMESLIALAVWIGKTRLIDNAIIQAK